MQNTFEPQGWKLVRVTGSDAIDFLQRVTTIDLQGLGVESANFGFLLRANGKIVEFFHATRLEHSALLASPHAETLIAELEKLHFREDLEFSIVAGRRVTLEWSGSMASARLTTDAGAPMTVEAFHDARVAETFPWVDHEITNEVTPVEVNGLFAVSRDKGCYPGQEVIEKMLSGRIPRKLVRMDAEQLDKLSPTVGAIVTTRHSSDGSALVMMNTRHLK
jgi:folate-binding protein YgfZ